MVGESKHIIKEQTKTQLNHGASRQSLKVGKNIRQDKRRKHGE